MSDETHHGLDDLERLAKAVYRTSKRIDAGWSVHRMDQLAAIKAFLAACSPDRILALAERVCRLETACRGLEQCLEEQKARAEKAEAQVAKLREERDAAQQQAADHQRGENGALNRLAKAEAQVANDQRVFEAASGALFARCERLEAHVERLREALDMAETDLTAVARHSVQLKMAAWARETLIIVRAALAETEAQT